MELSNSAEHQSKKASILNGILEIGAESIKIDQITRVARVQIASSLRPKIVKWLIVLGLFGLSFVFVSSGRPGFAEIGTAIVSAVIGALVARFLNLSDTYGAMIETSSGSKTYLVDDDPKTIDAVVGFLAEIIERPHDQRNLVLNVAGGNIVNSADKTEYKIADARGSIFGGKDGTINNNF
jgi:hypothetical protein